MIPEPSGTHGGTDVSSLCLPQNIGGNLGLKEVLTTIRVMKPDRQSFIRVHPDPTYCLRTVVLHVKDANEWYLVHPDLWADLQSETTEMELHLAITRQGVPFIWPVRVPKGKRSMGWHQSAAAAAGLAMTTWIRVCSNMGRRAYEVIQASGINDEPMWPNMTFREIIEVAFRNRFIDTRNHVALRRLRGEI